MIKIKPLSILSTYLFLSILKTHDSISCDNNIYKLFNQYRKNIMKKGFVKSTYILEDIILIFNKDNRSQQKMKILKNTQLSYFNVK